MASYILLQNSDDKVLEEADSTRFRKTGVPPVLKSEKGIRWLDLVVVDPVKGKGADQIKEGPVIDITDTTYTRTWTVRDKTANEKDTDKTIEVEFRFDAIKLLLKALNKGTFIPGSNYTVEQMKDILKGEI